VHDNNKMQKVADITQLQDARGQPLTAAQRLPQPAYSPDMNRAIEHVFGRLKNQMRHEMYRWMVHHPNSAPTLAEFAAMIRSTFFSRGTAEGRA
jgi:hypothetical protein